MILVSVLCGNLVNASLNQPQLWLLANKNVFYSNSVIKIDLERSSQNIYLSKQDFLSLVSVVKADNPLTQSDSNFGCSRSAESGRHITGIVVPQARC